MKIKAESKFIRTSYRKLRLVADLVRPMSLNEALDVLKHLNKRAAEPILKTFKQAVANAVNNHNLPKDSLKIHSLEINEGPTYKRWNPVSRGRAHSIFKRTSHIKIVLKSVIKKPKVTKKPAKTKKPASTKRKRGK
ncbi:50S ribosomal protein L22 [Patescibacteria group bacterium]